MAILMMQFKAAVARASLQGASSGQYFLAIATRARQAGG
jgi:hypothetical protein